ncbi:MAG: DUF211 domain-containing protein [Haloferacaceae archaeon]
MLPVRRVVLDVLKPADPSTVDLARLIADVDGVAGVNAVVVDVTPEIQTIKLTIEGDAVDVDAVESTIDARGASVHSIDRVVRGERPPGADANEAPRDRP